MLEPAIVASGNDEKTTEGGKLIFFMKPQFLSFLDLTWVLTDTDSRVWIDLAKEWL